MTTTTTAAPTRRDPELLGQTVVVIGGSSGIGLATATRARAEGANVILTGHHNDDALQRAARDLEALSIAAFDANGPGFADWIGLSLAVRDRLGQRSAPGSRGKGVGEVLGLVRYETVGDLHDDDRICGHAIVGDHALAHPKLAAAQDPADGEVALRRMPPALRLDL
jgi:hypothetical protein